MRKVLRIVRTMLVGGSVFCMLLAISQPALADARTLGEVAAEIIKSFKNITLLITASSYLAGIGFSIGAVLKFKQHKDNPTQIPIGTPIAMLFIAAALLFLPSVLTATRETMFGKGGGETAGPEGTIFVK